MGWEETVASQNLAGNTTEPELIVPDPADKLARHTDGVGARGTPEDEMSKIIKKKKKNASRPKTKIGIKPGMTGWSITQEPLLLPRLFCPPVATPKTPRQSCGRLWDQPRTSEVSADLWP